MVIVGGGIGGLTAALCLERFGHHPVVIEQAAELRPVGAGLSLWPNGIKVLNLLGLGLKVASLGGTMERMAYADAGGRPLVDFALGELYDRVGERARPIARARLQDLLLAEVRSALGPGGVQLGARVVAVSDGAAGASVAVEDGRSFAADVVVAADGTHSRLRDAVVGHAVERRYVGYVNWNGLVPESVDMAPIGTWLTWVGAGRRASIMPVGGGQCYWFFDVPMAAGAVDALPDHRQVLADRFAGWAPAVQTMIERLDPARVARIPIHDVEPLPTWVRDRTVLLGDAAHSMAPDLGQGGCQAIEDAWVLTHHLTATGRGVADALARYQAERMPHTADMTRRARNRSDLTHAVAPAATEGWYKSLATDGHAGIVDGLAQSVETGPCR
ncbi:MAG: FAD-dependent monooxygenase [Actinomycetota bacterium]|nr:FAD-dependent monooxygenase [Actinomycetota bacterium]